jgi:proline iminopeptidase
VRAAINGVELFFDVEGAGTRPLGPRMVDTPPCFVLHGGPALDHSYFKPWLSPLADDFQLIYVDHRGTGGSSEAPPSTYCLEQMADDLEALRHHLGLASVDVLGNSYGGFLALTYALRFPASIGRLFLVGTSASHRYRIPSTRNLELRGSLEQKEAIGRLRAGTFVTPEDYTGIWRTIMPLYFQAADPVTIDETVSRIRGNAATAKVLLVSDIPRYDVELSISLISVPTLVTVGRHDWVTPPEEAERLASRMPNAKLIVYEKSGHFPFIEENRRFVEDMRGFANEHPRPATTVPSDVMMR